MSGADRYSFDSFVRGHHVYKDIWTPTIGESLHCMRELLNKKDKYAVAIMKDNKVVGHVPLSYSRHLSQFLQIRSSSLSCKVTGERVNRGGGYGLEVPCQYVIEGSTLAVNWLRKRIESERAIVDGAVSRNQEKRKKDASENAPQPKKQKHN